MDERPSWWLKLMRAGYHFEELSGLVKEYETEHRFQAVLANTDDRDRWRFVVEISERPNPAIAVVLGDCLFNIRSALDHIAVACAPEDRRRKAQFPIILDREKGPSQKLKDQLAGFEPGAFAVIEQEQPFVVRRDTYPPGTGRSVIPTIEILSELQNADKHRSLNVVVPRLAQPKVNVIWRDLAALPASDYYYLTPGADVFTWEEVKEQVSPEDLRVEVYGLPQVAVRAPDLPQEYPVLQLVFGILHHVESQIIPRLEPFARP
jgi:hypothetical protein